MSKLSPEHKFIDLSDYGRPIAKIWAKNLVNTSVTPEQITFLFGITGLVALYAMWHGYYVMAGLLLILKSILDALDGELARIKQTPSFTGRYLDSIFDSILNFLILLTLMYITDSSFGLMILAYLGMQLQCSFYNYYHVILRTNSVGSDKTSKIFETKPPKAHINESQKMVNILFYIFNILYKIFDKTVQAIDSEAWRTTAFSGWFMTLVSVYGLGFQLLIIALMMSLGYIEFILPFFIWYSILIFIFVGIRKKIIQK